LSSRSYNVFKGYDWYHLPLQVTNKAICWTALNGFAITMLPGLFARMSNAIYRDSLRTKPRWMTSFLGMRKYIGLLSLWFLFVHIFMSLLLFSPAYYSKFFVDPEANSSKLNAIGESSFFFAIIGACLFCILGVCSLPSVANQMTNSQWQFLYGPLVWIALLFGTIHVLIMGVAGWTKTETWPGGLPPITLTSTIIPMIAMYLKLVQAILSRVMWSNMEKTPSHYRRRKQMTPPPAPQTHFKKHEEKEMSRALVPAPTLTMSNFDEESAGSAASSRGSGGKRKKSAAAVPSLLTETTADI
jgi:hypothetical protein